MIYGFQFTILKIVNRITKVKEVYTVKLKMISIRPHQTRKKAENILRRNKWVTSY